MSEVRLKDGESLRSPEAVQAHLREVGLLAEVPSVSTTRARASSAARSEGCAQEQKKFY